MKLSSSQRALRTLAKFVLFCGKEKPGLEGTRLVMQNWTHGASLHKAFARNVAAAKQWAERGWYPYEEVQRDESLTTGMIHEHVTSGLHSIAFSQR